MEIERKDFPEIISDNDETFLGMIIGIIDSVDELCSLEIRKTPSYYRFRIAPSIPKYVNSLIYALTTFNNLFGIKLEMGKSIKTSSVITFDIILNE